MEGVGLKFTSVIARHCLGPLSVCGYIDGTSWTNS